MAFKFIVLHVKGESNISGISRITEEYVDNVINQATPKAISLELWRLSDLHVLAAVQSDDWTAASNDKQMLSYYNVRAEPTNAGQDVHFHPENIFW